MGDHRAGGRVLYQSAQAKEAAVISDPKPQVLPAAELYLLPTFMSITGWM